MGGWDASSWRWGDGAAMFSSSFVAGGVMQAQSKLEPTVEAGGIFSKAQRRLGLRY